MNFNKIAIIGAGAYGTALAQSFSSQINTVYLLSNIRAVCEEINTSHTHSSCFPNIQLSHNIKSTQSYEDILDSDLIFFSTPSSCITDVCHLIKQHNIQSPIVSCSKGLDITTGQLLSEKIQNLLDNELFCLSGPSYAKEIIARLPAGVNIAGKNFKMAECIATNLSSNAFKIEVIDDFIGLQLCGALKNILAVGCGILNGLNMGMGAVSKLITVSKKEIGDIIEKFGGHRSTTDELCGIGDLILTCTSAQSRNVSFGKHLALGGSICDWQGELAEGALAAKAIPIIENKIQMKTKVFSNIYAIIYAEHAHKSSMMDNISLAFS